MSFNPLGSVGPPWFLKSTVKLLRCHLRALFAYFFWETIMAWGFVVLKGLHRFEYFQSCWGGQLDIVMFFFNTRGNQARIDHGDWLSSVWK